MAFGAGVLISALGFELMDEAWDKGGFVPVAGGFFGGALIYTVANKLLAAVGAKHRKRADPEQRGRDKQKNADNGLRQSPASPLGLDTWHLMALIQASSRPSKLQRPAQFSAW
jgi:hypothetical protein